MDMCGRMIGTENHHAGAENAKNCWHWGFENNRMWGCWSVLSRQSHSLYLRWSKAKNKRDCSPA
jgi:hypothetical protein